MHAIMRRWLLNKEFSITEVGMLSMLVLQLGQPVQGPGHVRLLTWRGLKSNYLITRVLPDEEFHLIAKCQSPNLQLAGTEGNPAGTCQGFVLVCSFSFMGAVSGSLMN